MGEITFELRMIVYAILHLIIFTVYYFVTLKKRERWIDNRVIINAFFILYLLLIFRFVFTPFTMWLDSSNREQFIREILQREELLTWWEVANINLVPFRSLIQTLSAPLVIWRFTLLFVVGNLILLLPLPIFIGLLTKRELTFKKAFMIGFLTTLFIECMQLVINLATGWPNRLVCVDDLLLNTLGAMVGYFIFKKYHHFFEKIISQMYKFLTWS